MDISDTATEYEERAREAALLKQSLAVKHTQLKPIGLCLNCDEPVAEGVLFCDPSCTEDYETWQAAQSRCGRH